MHVCAWECECLYTYTLCIYIPAKGHIDMTEGPLMRHIVDHNKNKNNYIYARIHMYVCLRVFVHIYLLTATLTEDPMLRHVLDNNIKKETNTYTQMCVRKCVCRYMYACMGPHWHFFATSLTRITRKKTVHRHTNIDMSVMSLCINIYVR